MVYFRANTSPLAFTAKFLVVPVVPITCMALSVSFALRIEIPYFPFVVVCINIPLSPPDTLNLAKVAAELGVGPVKMRFVAEENCIDKPGTAKYKVPFVSKFSNARLSPLNRKLAPSVTVSPAVVFVN